MFILQPRHRGHRTRLMVSLFPCLGDNLGTVPDSSPTAPTDPGTPFGTLAFTSTMAGNDGVNTLRHNYTYPMIAR